MKTNKPVVSFWLTNISKRNVSLADLNLTVNSFSSVNLMDKKHYSYTLEQLTESASKGSIFSKRNRLVVRQVAPEIIKMNIPFNNETFLPTRERSTFSIKEEKYEELNISDEEFAKENADTAELDSRPLIAKGK